MKSSGSTFWRWLTPAFSVFLLSGCSDIGQSIENKLINAVNAKWPPVTADDRLRAAILSAHENLKAIPVAHAALSIEPEILREQIANNLPDELTNPQVKLTQQAITLSAGFAYQVPVAGTTVKLAGQVQGLVGISVEHEALVLRPAFQAIILDSVTLGSDVKLDSVVDGVNGALGKFLANLNGNLSALEPRRFQFIPPDPVKLPDSGSGPVPVYVDAAAFLVGEDGLQALAHMSLKKSDNATRRSTAGTGSGSIDTLYKAYRSEFESLRTRDVGTPDPSQPIWVRVSATMLSGLLAEIYPPVTAVRQRCQAIGKAMEALKTLDLVNAAAFVSADLLQSHLQRHIDGELKKHPEWGLSQPEVSLGRQQITLTTRFARDLQQPSGRVEGRISGFVAVGAQGKNVSFYPALTSIHIENTVLKAAEWDPQLALPAVNDILAQLLSTVNGVLAKNTPPPYVLQLDPIKPIELAESLRKDPLFINPEGNVIQVPLQIAAASTLIGPDGVTLLLQMAFGAAEIPPSQDATIDHTQDISEAEVENAYSDLSATVEARVAPLFDGSERPKARAWVAVSKNVLNESLNTAMGSLRLCADVDLAKIKPADITLTIGSDEHEQIDCSSSRDCTPHQCRRHEDDTRDCTPHSCEQRRDNRDCTAHSCEQRTDNRDCSRDINAFGRKIGSYNDPICEAAKVAQNAIYAAEKAGCDLDAARLRTQCEAAKGAQNAIYATEKAGCDLDAARLRTQCEAAKGAQNAIYATEYAGCHADAARRKAQCEAEKAAHNFACEASKEATKQVTDYGQVTGQLHISGTPKICLSGFKASDALSRVVINAGISGQAHVRAAISYIPHNVIGHLACVAKWSSDIHADLTIQGNRDNLVGAIAATDTPDGVRLAMTTAEKEFVVNMSPEPLDALFRNNPEALLKCQLAAMIGYSVQLADSVARSLGGGIANELNGNFKISLKGQTHELLIKPVEMELGGERLRAVPHWGGASAHFSVP